MSNRFQRLAAKTDNLPCREDPELFFQAESALGEPNEYSQQAQMLCLRCPISFQCLEEALIEGEQFGIYGGLTTSQRQSLHQRSAA